MNHVDYSEREPIGCRGFQGPCESGLPAKWQRQNTQYCDDEKNWICSCDECAEAINDSWQERWDELNADLYAGIQDAFWTQQLEQNQGHLLRTNDNDVEGLADEQNQRSTPCNPT